MPDDTGEFPCGGNLSFLDALAFLEFLIEGPWLWRHTNGPGDRLYQRPTQVFIFLFS